MENKTFRLFISSTFNDFLMERKLLNEQIFSEINKFCLSKGYSFQLVDLRWGINSESALNQKTIDICLKEVKRCKNLSPRPNFLLMLGERYGWLPLPYSIKKDLFEKIINKCNNAEKKLIETWYVLDRNEIGGSYYLRKRVGIYEYDDEWSVIENSIHDIFESIAYKYLDSETEINQFILSATEQEIVEGFFVNTKYSDNTIALFREGYPSKDSNLINIQKLKNSIYQKMKNDNCLENLICLDWDEEYNSKFVSRMIEVLKSNIAKEISRIEIPNKKETFFDKTAISKFYSSCFIGRDEEINCICKFINEKEFSKMCVFGESGSGKSTLLSQYIKQSNEDVLFAFFGMNEMCYSLFSVMQHLCLEIKEKYDIRSAIDMNQYNISEAFYSVLHLVPPSDKLVIMIDAIESYYDIDSIKENFFSVMIPENIKIIVSVSDDIIYNKFIDDSFYTLYLNRFDSFDGKKILNRLLYENNRLISNSNQMELINHFYESPKSPLSTKVLFNIIKNWHSYDEDVTISNDVSKLVKNYIDNMFIKFGHNKEFVLSALAIISVSPFGVTENELLSLLFDFPKVKAYFVSEDRYNYNLSSLPFVIWSRLFYDMEDCLTLVEADGNIIIKFKHAIYKSVISEYYNSYCEQAKEIMISFYSHQNNTFINSETLNFTKLKNLPELLFKTNRISELECLFCNIDFIDCQIKSGSIDYTIYIIRKLIDECCSQKEFLTKILKCIYNNRKYLESYNNTFLICAQSCSLVDKRECFILNNTTSFNEFYFPYGKDSHICWQAMGRKYAVYNRNYIYICNADDNVETARIFVYSGKGENSIITKLIWIDDVRLLVCSKIMFNDMMNTITVYNISNDIPDKELEFNCNGNCSCIKYSGSENSIILSYNDSIISKSLKNGMTNFSIFIGKIKEIQFYVDERNREIIVRDKFSYISFYNLTDGLLKKRIKFKSRKGYYDFAELKGWINGSEISKISDNLVFIYRNFIDDYNLFCIYNLSHKKSIYLNPPKISKPLQFLMGKEIMIISFEGMLLSIELFDDYNMHYFMIDNHKSISWKIIDSQLCIDTEKGFEIVTLSDFSSFEQELKKCFVSTKNLLNGFKNPKSNVIHGILPLFSLCFDAKHNETSYNIIFSNMVDAYNLKSSKEASIIIFSKSGIKAIAYEQIGAIKVIDQMDKEIICIDRLNLSLLDNILCMKFSLNSDFLLIHTNLKIYIISISERKLITSLDISKTPVLFVDFKVNSKELEILFCNNKKVIFNIYDKRKRNFVSYINNDDTKKEIYAGPYKYLKPYGTVNLFNLKSENFSHPKYYVSNTRVYATDDDYILFDNGEFYFNGVKEMKFSHNYIDFNQVIAIQRLSDESAFSCYLREKNDLFSQLIKYNSQYYILISRMLNSVLVFDVSDLKIISAYKHENDIIGWGLHDRSELLLFSAKTPYQTIININL